MLDWLLLGLRLISLVLMFLFIGLMIYRLRQTPQPNWSSQDYLRHLDKPNILILLQTQTSIGRDPNNTLVIEDEFVSIYHAQITYIDSIWWLTDLDSTSGTKCNDDFVHAPQQLQDGDILSFGQVRFRLEYGNKK